jgi:hypothetical protein
MLFRIVVVCVILSLLYSQAAAHNHFLARCCCCCYCCLQAVYIYPCLNAYEKPINSQRPGWTSLSLLCYSQSRAATASCSGTHTACCSVNRRPLLLVSPCYCHCCCCNSECVHTACVRAEHACTHTLLLLSCQSRTPLPLPLMLT